MSGGRYPSRTAAAFTAALVIVTICNVASAATTAFLRPTAISKGRRASFKPFIIQTITAATTKTLATHHVNVALTSCRLGMSSDNTSDSDLEDSASEATTITKLPSTSTIGDAAATNVSSEDSTSTKDVATAVANAASTAFEEWMRHSRVASKAGVWLDPRVHQSTQLQGGSLRGLIWHDKSDIDIDIDNDRVTGTMQQQPLIKTKTINVVMAARIPSSMVLSSSFQSPTWDRDLAILLWKAYCRCSIDQNDDSALLGYVRYLTQTNGPNRSSPLPPAPNANIDDRPAMVPLPPSTAPHCLRRWTLAQRSRLLTTEPGRHLVALHERQEQAWQRHYASLDTSDNVATMTWEQFQWAMEAVHSRAFCGIQNTMAVTSPNLVMQLAPSIVAAVAGMVYVVMSPQPSEVVLVGLALVTAVAALVTTRASSSRNGGANGSSAAVLLPWIDSANHLSNADSSIVFDPLSNTFELYIGPKCLVQESDATSAPAATDMAQVANTVNVPPAAIPTARLTQLYISYGNKSNAELLLNFGFLPCVAPFSPSSSSSSCHDDEIDDCRRRLAEAFLQSS